MNDDHADDALAEEIRLLQTGLKEYVAGLLGGLDGVEDLVQETNLFLWERRSEFEAGTNFRAWAMRVAWFKVMAERRDRARAGRVVFSEAMLEHLASHAEQRMPESDLRLAALRVCLERTRPQDRRLLDWKYGRGAALTDLAAASGCAATAIHKRFPDCAWHFAIAWKNDLKTITDEATTRSRTQASGGRHAGQQPDPQRGREAGGTHGGGPRRAGLLPGDRRAGGAAGGSLQGR